jgi:hypothetical protein
MMAERGLMVDHTTVWRWCQKYGPMIYQRLRGKLKYTTHFGGPIQFDCWRIVWSFVDTAAGNARRLANLESLRGGIPENESGNDIDRNCSPIEDRLIRSDCLKHFSSWLARFATLPFLSAVG